MCLNVSDLSEIHVYVYFKVEGALSKVVVFAGLPSCCS